MQNIRYENRPYELARFQSTNIATANTAAARIDSKRHFRLLDHPDIPNPSILIVYKLNQ